MAQTAHSLYLPAHSMELDHRRSPTPSSRRLSASSRIMRPPSSLSSTQKPTSLDSTMMESTSPIEVSRRSSGIITPPLSPRLMTGGFEKPAASRNSDYMPCSEFRLPDMFASIMSVQAHMNPHYKMVKPEADAAVARLVLKAIRLVPRQC